MPMKPMMPATATAAPTAAGGDDDGDELGALDVDAEVKGFDLAQQEAVEAADEPRRHDGDQHRERHDGEHLRPVGAAEAAHRPECQIAQLAVVAGVGDEAGQGARQRAKRDAREQQRADHELAVAAGDGDEDAGRGDAAEERGDGKRIDPQRLQQRGGRSRCRERWWRQRRARLPRRRR